MGRNKCLEEKEEYKSEDMNPSCVKVLIDAIDYHQWKYNIQQKILPLKRYHAKRSQDSDFIAYHEEENVFSSTKKKGLTKRRILRGCLKKLISHSITRERTDKEVVSKALSRSRSRSRLERSFSMHHRFLDIPSNWDQPIIFIPGNKDDSIQSIQVKDAKQKDLVDEKDDLFESSHLQLHVANATLSYNEISSGIDEYTYTEEKQCHETFLEKKSDHFHEDSLIKTQNPLDKSLTSFVEDLPDSISNDGPDHINDLINHKLNKMDALNPTLHSWDKLKITSLFEEIKAFFNQELKYFKEDSCNSWQYQLLLDLVMEELIHLHDRSSLYYPKALSYSCHIRRFPIGNEILQEVCSSISALVNLMKDEKECMDDAFDLDLKRDDSWMNLQLKSEYVVLDVVNIIFEELIQELKY